MKGKIFNAQEVQAMLNGSKVMFREVIKKSLKDFKNIKINQDGELSAYNKTEGWYEELKNIKCPYQVGQKIFCKESFAEILYASDSEYRFGKKIIYRAEDDSHVIWKLAQHMKQEQSRITMLIKEIKVERLADISEEDAIAEGVMNHLRIVHYNPVEYFRQLWNATHKKPEEKFEANPFVFVYRFELIK
jgi:hypothetical protein